MSVVHLLSMVAIERRDYLGVLFLVAMTASKRS